MAAATESPAKKITAIYSSVIREFKQSAMFHGKFNENLFNRHK
jgi:hypothetical protein